MASWKACLSAISAGTGRDAAAGFELVGGESRKLIGTYLRWDEIRSMARVKAAANFPDRLL